MNQVTLTGTLTKDSELRYSTSGTPVCNFSIAVNEYVKGEQKVQYFNIVSFSAEKLSAYLVKGTKVLISGKLNNSSYEKDGQKKYKTDIVASSYGGIELLGGKKDNQNSGSQQNDYFSSGNNEDLTMVDNSDDCPF